MLLFLLSLYLLLGVLVSNAHASVVSYAFALTSWPLLIVGLGLRSRFVTRPVPLPRCVTTR